MLYYSRNIVLLYLIVVSIVFSSCKDKVTSSQFICPAEFESCNVISFVWSEDTVFHNVVLKLVSKISQKDNVRIYLENGYNDRELLPDMFNQNGSNLRNIEFEEIKNLPQSVWLRDYGPEYLQNENGDLKIANFKYFGKSFAFNQQIGNKRNIDVISSNLNSSGGAREVNGKGTIILVEAHELDVNQPQTKDEIEEQIKKDLNLKKVIWLKKGIPQDDNILGGPLFGNVYPSGVNGHIDEFCRFANANTILISAVDKEETKNNPLLEEAKKRMDDNYNILINSTDQDGNKFNIIKVPIAPVLVSKFNTEGELYKTAVTSYMNFIISTSYIILPSYVSAASDSNRERYINKEQEVVSIFQKVFAHKEIVTLPATDLNFHSGGFHCLSIDEPL